MVTQEQVERSPVCVGELVICWQKFSNEQSYAYHVNVRKYIEIQFSI